MHCKAPVWVKPNLGEAQLGHQASAEYKLRFCLHLRHVYFGAVYSAGSETERVALKKRSETQNRSTIQIVTTKYVSALAQCHARHLQHHQTPTRAAGLTRARTGMHPLQQGPSRQGWQTELQQQGIICRCMYSVCLSTTHNTLRCTHHGCRTFYGSDPEMPRLSLCIGLGIPVLVVHWDLVAKRAAP